MKYRMEKKKKQHFGRPGTGRSGSRGSGTVDRGDQAPERSSTRRVRHQGFLPGVRSNWSGTGGLREVFGRGPGQSGRPRRVGGPKVKHNKTHTTPHHTTPHHTTPHHTTPHHTTPHHTTPHHTTPHTLSAGVHVLAAPLSMQSSHAGFDSDVISTAGVPVPLVAALSVSVCRDLTAGARLEFRSGPVGTMRVPESGQHLAVDVRATVIDVGNRYISPHIPQSMVPLCLFWM